MRQRVRLSALLCLAVASCMGSGVALADSSPPTPPVSPTSPPAADHPAPSSYRWVTRALPAACAKPSLDAVSARGHYVLVTCKGEAGEPQFVLGEKATALPGAQPENPSATCRAAIVGDHGGAGGVCALPPGRERFLARWTAAGVVETEPTSKTVWALDLRAFDGAGDLLYTTGRSGYSLSTRWWKAKTADASVPRVLQDTLLAGYDTSEDGLIIGAYSKEFARKRFHNSPVAWRTGEAKLLMPMGEYTGGTAHAISANGQHIIGVLDNSVVPEPKPPVPYRSAFARLALSGPPQVFPESLHGWWQSLRGVADDGTFVVGSSADATLVTGMTTQSLRPLLRFPEKSTNTVVERIDASGRLHGVLINEAEDVVAVGYFVPEYTR